MTGNTKPRFTIPAAAPSGSPVSSPAAVAFVNAPERASGGGEKERLIPRFPLRLTDADFARLEHHCARQERPKHYFTLKGLQEYLDRLDADEKAEKGRGLD